jgi:hypothetical protein
MNHAPDIDSHAIETLRAPLDDHPVYAAVKDVGDLRCFMEHHVFAVWDFMSLIKYLQSMVAPSRYPWQPQGDPAVRRFINELVLEEETDQAPGGEGFTSHFELYQQAMREIGADPAPSARFVEAACRDGLAVASALPGLPVPSVEFTTRTFSFLTGDRPHAAAAALALGREHVIPGMFRSILARIGVSESQAPAFHYYLNRHVHLDEDFHAPLSLRLLNSLCAGDPERAAEAAEAARDAVAARLHFWDGVHSAITRR